MSTKITAEARRKVHERSGGRCEVETDSGRCMNMATSIHHNIFASRGGSGEDIEELTDTCSGCHHKIQFEFFKPGNEWTAKYRKRGLNDAQLRESKLKGADNV